MPYKSIKAMNPALKGIVPKITLAMGNLIARWADSIKARRGDVNPWAIAIALFRRTFHIENKKWVKNAGSKAKNSLADDVLDLVEGLEDLGMGDIPMYFPVPAIAIFPGYSEGDEMEVEDLDELLRVLAELGFEVTTSEDLQPTEGVFEAAYVIDLLADLPKTPAGRPDFSQPFRILPTGTLYRYGKRVVTEEDIAEFSDNWNHRAERGIRRTRIVVDAEHQTGGIGWYSNIYSRGADGLWATIALSVNGKKLLAERDFYFFSPMVAWRSKDRVTGKEIKNQIVGGALTNFPVFGDATALPLSYSEAAGTRIREMLENPEKKGETMSDFTQEDRGLLKQIAEMFSNILSPTKGGDDMSDQTKDDGKTKDVAAVTVEQFNELQANLSTVTAQVEALSTERDALKTQVAEGQTRLDAEMYARQLQEMREHVLRYNRLPLPLTVPEGAPEGTLTAPEHFAWLQAADTTEGQKHWTFFNSLFGAANTALTEAGILKEVGSTEIEDLSTDDHLDKAAHAYMRENECDYITALRVVAAERAAPAAN